jgi:ABC-type uncharacterized transport system auxiliary subunit
MKQPILLFSFVIMILTGCGSQKTIVRKYYMLEEPDSISNLADSDSSQTINAWCEINEVEVYPAFETRRIVLRDASNQIRYFGDHEWANRPSEILTPLIIDFFSTRKIFKRTSDRFWDKIPDYQIKTTVFNIEVGTTKKRDFQSHLKVRFELIDTKTDTIVVSHTSDRRSILKERNLNLLAASVSNIFHEELMNFALQIKKTLPTDK